MHFYRIVDVTTTTDEILVYCERQGEAHAHARDYGEWRWPKLRIELVDVSLDKSSIAGLLNGVGAGLRTPLRTWRITPRGGMVEVENGE